MKKFLSILLVVLAIVSIAAMASATELASGTCGTNAIWSYADGVLTISGTGSATLVNYDHPWEAYIPEITTAVVEEGITSLSQCFFYNHTALASVSLPDSLTTIGEQVFQACDALTEVTIPKNVTNIGNDRAAFVFSCNQLQAIHVDPENTSFYSIDGVLFSYAKEALLCFPEGKTAATYTVPAGIKTVARGAFTYAAINQVILPDGLQTLEDAAFLYSDITSIELPETLTTICEGAFDVCDQLTALTVPAGVTRIERIAFQNCKAMESITILTPDCVLPDDRNLIWKDTVIHGYAGSTAEKYAQAYGRSFCDLESGETVSYDQGNTGYIALLPTNPGTDFPAYCRNSFKLSTDTVLSSGWFDGYILIERNTTNATYQEILAQVTELTKDCTTDYEKAENIYNWLRKNFTRKSNYQDAYTPEQVYETWTNKVHSASSGTSLTNFMLHLAGIPNATVRYNQYTCWSAALVDGQWILIDTYRGLFNEDYESYREIQQIEFAVNGNLLCVINDLTGVKLLSYGQSIYDRYLETELTIPNYVNYIYKSALILYNSTFPVIHGVAGSYAENYIKENLYKYGTFLYEDGMFTAKPTEYGVSVSGVPVNIINYRDVLGDGTVYYNVDTNTLTLNNANLTVTGQSAGIFTEKDLNIELLGENYLSVSNDSTEIATLSGIYTGGDLKLCGEGKLRVDMEGNPKEMVYGIRVLGAMTLEAEVEVDGSYKITSPACAVHADIIYANAPKLTSYMETAIIVDTGIYTADTIRVFNAAEGFTEGVPCTLTSPVPFEWPVTIGYEPYWLSFNGIQITSENAHDIMGDGTVYYDEETDTITLNNANHTLKGGIGGGYWPGSMIIRVNVIGENHLTIENGGFIGTVDGHVYVSGPGSLDLDINSSDEYGAIGIEGSSIKISVNRLDMTIRHHCDNPEVDPYSDVYTRGIRTNNLTLSCNELNIDVTSNLDAYGIFIYGYDGGINNSCENLRIKAETTNPDAYTATAIHVFTDLTVTKGRMELMGDTAVSVGNAMTLPEGYVVEGAAEEFINGTTTTLTQADPNVPVVIGPKPPVVIPELTGKSFTLSFEDEILVNFYYTVSDLTDVAEHGMLVFYSDPGTVDILNADAVYENPVYDAAKDRYMATTDGIAAKEMGDSRYYVAYAKLTDGTYAYSGTYDYSPKKYAMNMLSKASTSDKQKTLCVAMLNYGAAAQEYFGYNTSSLMNSDLTAEQKALVTAYDAGLFAGAVAADDAKVGSFVKTEGFSKKSVTVSFEGAFAINYYFTPDRAVNGDMTLYYWTAEDYAARNVLSPWNPTGTVTMTPGADGRYWASISGIPAKALDDTYYVAAVYTDADGNTYCTGVIAYSLSKYCMNNASGSMGTLAQATAMYGYYAKQYFTN